jgi:hypothetical protein
MTNLKVIKPRIELLDFDPLNPRFFDLGAGEIQTEEKTIKRMMELENLDELVGSIGQQGFFPGEPLLVTANPDKPGHYIVVEGNRRLAALRVLNGIVPIEKITSTLADAVKNAKNKPDNVDCFEFPKRQDILKYLGFRHISGPRRWEPLSKARYLADLIVNFYSNLTLNDQLRSVACDIGSRRDYVAKLLTALNIYDRAKSKKFYNLHSVDETTISFSLLSTALSYKNIYSFLGLSSSECVTVDNVNDKHTKELLGWMFSQNARGETVLGESRHLKKLAAIVESERAITELRKHEDLESAYVFTNGPAEAFTLRLNAAESAVADCLSLLNGNVDPDEGHGKQVGRIVNSTENLQLLVQKALSRGKRERQDRDI